MEKSLNKKVTEYVLEHISEFHNQRIKSLDKLNLRRVLKRKNPYLYKAKYVLTSGEIVKGLVEAHISSNEETIFGTWLEGLAIFINSHIYKGNKSGIEGIDLEFNRDGKRYIVAIKSGPNWGNSDQIKKMISNFNTAKKTFRTGGSKVEIISINGCCYGRDNNPDKGAYFKYCGQSFWEFISGDANLFREIIKPIGAGAKDKNEAFLELYSKKINLFTSEFSKEFCKEDGEINWDKLVEVNSGK